MNRLNLTPRKISEEEEILRSKLHKIELDIKNLKKEKKIRKKQLLKRQKQQIENGLGLSEIKVTDSLVESKLSVYDAQIKRLQKDYQALKSKEPGLQKQSQKQTHLNL